MTLNTFRLRASGIIFFYFVSRCSAQEKTTTYDAMRNRKRFLFRGIPVNGVD